MNSLVLEEEKRTEDKIIEKIRNNQIYQEQFEHGENYEKLVKVGNFLSNN